MAVCKHCQAPIRFVRSRAGRPLPVDPHPDKTGAVAATEVLSGRWGDAYVVTPAQPVLPGYRTFVAHFATCTRRPPTPDRPRPAPVQDTLI